MVTAFYLRFWSWLASWLMKKFSPEAQDGQKYIAMPVAQALIIKHGPGFALVYSEEGRGFDPYFSPHFSAVIQLAHMRFDALVARTAAVEQSEPVQAEPPTEANP